MVFIFSSPPCQQPAAIIIGLSGMKPQPPDYAHLSAAVKSTGLPSWKSKNAKKKKVKRNLETDFLISSRLFTQFDKWSRLQVRFVQ